MANDTIDAVGYNPWDPSSIKNVQDPDTKKRLAASLAQSAPSAPNTGMMGTSPNVENAGGNGGSRWGGGTRSATAPGASVATAPTSSVLAGGWGQFSQKGSAQDLLGQALSSGLTGEDAVQFAAKGGAPGIAYYADKNQFGLPNGFYVAPNPQNSSSYDLIQRGAEGNKQTQNAMMGMGGGYNFGAPTQINGSDGAASSLIQQLLGQMKGGGAGNAAVQPPQPGQMAPAVQPQASQQPSASNPLLTALQALQGNR